MNTNFRRQLVYVNLFGLLVWSLMACSVARSAVDEYHTLITAYQNTQMAAANGQSCIVLSFSAMTNSATLANNYMQGVANQTTSYREPLRNFGTKMAAQEQTLQDQAAAYKDSAGKPLDPTKLDLADLVNKNATPANMALTLQVYATTFNEAPLPPLNPQPVINAQRQVSESTNQAFACVKDWNDAVRTYNVERNKIPGDAVGRIAEYLKVKELPQSLPYFTMPGPTAPPALPTLGK